MLTILGWFRAEADFASRMKRSARLALGAESLRRTLMATTRFSRLSRALYTSPMPPAPSGARISYGPSFVPEVSTIGDGDYSLGGAARSSGYDDSEWIVGQPEVMAKLGLLGLLPACP